MKLSKKIAIVCVFLSTVTMLSACGTVNGFGHDVSRTGNAISNAAR